MTAEPHRVLLLNKPYGVLCQFTDEEGRPTLAGLVPVPRVYAAGRLDHDSEGLVVLTDSGTIQNRIADPRHKMPKTYWAQVEGTPEEPALRKLESGVLLQGETARAASARVIDPPAVWPRVPPIRERRAIPTAWIEITLREGKNRQVRRMTAAVGLPTLRLIRVSVGPWALGDLAPGAWRDAPAETFKVFLREDPPVRHGAGTGRRGTEGSRKPAPERSRGGPPPARKPRRG